MEATGRNLLTSPPSFPSKTHLKNGLYSSSSASPAITSVSTTLTARHLPTSVLLQEQRDELRPLSHLFKEEKTPQTTLDGRQMESGALINEEKISGNLDQLVQDFEHQLLHWPGLWNFLSPSQTSEDPSSLLTTQSVVTDSQPLMDVEPSDAISLAERALSASKLAASLAQDTKSGTIEADIDYPLSTSSGSNSSSNFPIEEVKIVRSTRVLERWSKRRNIPKPNVIVHEMSISRRADVKRKLKEGFDPNDPLRLFLWGPETTQLLSFKEESELIVQIQNLLKLEEVKSRLQSQFGREPTLIEWAEAVGMSHQVLRSQLHSGNRSREKLINANLRMVVHIAKQYQGRGLSLQDLMQEGSMGLMKSVKKFKPQAGCRFASYAYWWIRQMVRKAIFQHSKTIRLPERFYSLLGKVMEAKKSYIQEGNHHPSIEELAGRVGITVDKLQKLILSTRNPLSMQQPVWADQKTTLQEITADPEIEVPDLSVSKQLMRQHVRNLLSVLSQKEKQIIRLRFGIGDGEQRSLSEIGNIFGLSKERVRQLENRAIYKLKQCLDNQGLDAYANLII
ncbi:Sigma70_r3 domain-containing protein/Sigma70_r2 domain-containing protein/Sigma70_r4 domain-containing protein [Cephalotus follicularis]|uniref:RNA polymerase sigma factor n=1 Tax=Cephalotus follicularis TaxID=3775 RepID=A0A1Q3C697_CEPFO|nr:Sigma70_r3 domain-containing protein/Sigma70_r2 domain-containing protein/Sigma70_r4 domain-containing protein [Cephalotus follicularis]